MFGLFSQSAAHSEPGPVKQLEQRDAGGNIDDARLAELKNEAEEHRAARRRIIEAEFKDKVRRLKFFQYLIKMDKSRDYTIIVDRSGSMRGTRWKETMDTVKHLRKHVCDVDDDGISLYFFDHDFYKFTNILRADQIMLYFSEYRPRGTTNLANVLKDAVVPDWKEANRPCLGGLFGKSDTARGVTAEQKKSESILVITDGAPDSTADAERIIIEAGTANAVDDEITITFLQVGNDEECEKWLTKLDVELERVNTVLKAKGDLTSEIAKTKQKIKSLEKELEDNKKKKDETSKFSEEEVKTKKKSIKDMKKELQGDLEHDAMYQAIEKKKLKTGCTNDYVDIVDLLKYSDLVSKSGQRFDLNEIIEFCLPFEKLKERELAMKKSASSPKKGRSFMASFFHSFRADEEE